MAIPDNIGDLPVTPIGERAFWSWTSLTSITISRSVTSIGKHAFSYCSKLSGVYIEGNTPAGLGVEVFSYRVYHGLDPHYDICWDPATTYRWPGTTGWDDVSALTGLPVELWIPQVQASDASFSARTNHFGFNITWASGGTVVVEASTDLASPGWRPLQTNALTQGWAYFTDPDWQKYLRRFYRIRSQ